MHIEPGTTNVSIPIYCRTTDGDELLSRTAANFSGVTYTRTRAAPVAIPITDLASSDAVHSDGGIIELGNGTYRLDLPDAACAAGVANLSVVGTVDGGYVIPYPIDLHTTNGTGTRAVTFTVTSSSVPVQNARVRLYLAGMVDRIGDTNALGQVTLWCDTDATWSYGVTHPQYDAVSGTVVVDGNESVAVSMTVAPWPASTVPDTTTVRWRVRKTNRAWAGLDDCTVYMGIASGPGVAGTIYNGDNLDFDSDATDASGYVYFANTPKGATVAVKTATDGQVQMVQIPRDCGDTFEGLELIGSG